MPSTEEFNAQWRASAHEAVPYTNDFPESLLVLPELIDGSIGQGNATKVIIDIKLFENNTGYLKVTDNGIGVKNTRRLLSWASSESKSIHHRYGHGSKKCLTKWNKDYNCTWYVKYRAKANRGLNGLYKFVSPFKGDDTKQIEVNDDETELMPSGLEWYIEFNTEILKSKNNVNDLFTSVKEILRTRYSRKYFDKIEFIVKVSDGKNTIQENSKELKWKTFEEEVIEEIKKDNCVELYNAQIKFNNNTKMTYKVYFIKIYGGKSFNLKKEFKTYGQKNMNCSRIHIALNERTIEIAPIWRFIDGKQNNHNDFNGLIAFANFDNDKLKELKDDETYVDDLPTPCTTKVSFYENCKNFLKFRDMISKLNLEIIKKMDHHKDDKPQKPVTKVPQKKKVVKEKDEVKVKDEVKEKVEVNEKKVIKEKVVNDEKEEDKSDEYYVYLIQTVGNKNSNIYKIGKTIESDPYDRLRKYEKGLKFHFITFVDKNIFEDFESIVIEEFKNKFIHRNDIGKEYFEGDRQGMINCICELYLEQ